MELSMPNDARIDLRPPTARDGASVHRLVGQCPPLDPNSMYCNLLQCSHFADTSVAAELDGELQGFVSGYLIPRRPDTLFVWQVAVGEPARGQGLASRMINDILARQQCHGVRYIETSITESNRASWAVFEKLAKALNAELKTSVMFDRSEHFADQHDSETRLRIGPFNGHDGE
jgi:L-2,4-diaminobutyric acid acetyltransferase